MIKMLFIIRARMQAYKIDTYLDIQITTRVFNSY